VHLFPGCCLVDSTKFDAYVIVVGGAMSSTTTCHHPLVQQSSTTTGNLNLNPNESLFFPLFFFFSGQSSFSSSSYQYGSDIGPEGSLEFSPAKAHDTTSLRTSE
jgi:hypothetical protein